MSFVTLHDGMPCTDATATSRALHYGDGVFRTLLWSQGRAVDWALHVDKLAADCAAMDLRMPDADLLANEVTRVVGAAQAATVKIIVARKAVERGYRPAGSESERWVLASAAPRLDPKAYRDGIVLAASTVNVSEQPLLAGLKHLNRLDQVLASRAWPEGVDELLMTDTGGHVVGGTRTNLFCVTDSIVTTPRLDRCGVAGIMRRKILECSESMGLPTQLVQFSLSDLKRADEVFVCNALVGLWPVRAFEERCWSAPGAVTRKLMRALRHPGIETL